MIRLFCDRCGREINNNNYCLKLEIQETLYNGKNEFVIEPTCLSASRILCTNCDNQLKEFMKCQIVYY